MQDNGYLTGSIDFAPPSSKSGAAYNLTMVGAWNTISPLGVSLLELPAHSGDYTRWSGQLQLHQSTYFGFGILSETGVAVSASRNYVTPFLALPSASVLVSSDFPDGSNVSKNASFGGSPSQSTSTFNTSVDFTNMLSWFSENNKHRIKLTSELRRDDYTVNQTTNTLGTFSYNSLGDIEAGTPSLFTRTLSPNIQSGGQYIEGLALGDSYKATSDLQIQYGARLDGNQYVNAPVFDPEAVQQIYGVAHTYAPDHEFLSPRVGVSYTYGTAAQVAGFDGAIRGPRAVLSGGAGLFQNNPSTTLLSRPMGTTRPRERDPAGDPAPASGDANAGLGRIRHESGVDSDDVRERRGAHTIRQHGAKRRADGGKKGRYATAPRSLRGNSHVARGDPEQSVQCLGERHVFAQSQPA